MNDSLFDETTRTVAIESATRRRLLKVLTGGALGAASRLEPTYLVEAKRKRKKRKKKTLPVCGGPVPIQCPPPVGDPDGICYQAGTHCCSSATGGGACYVGNDCCPPSVAYPGGSCAAADEVCCSAATGGGSCSKDAPVCCGPSLFEPEGSCIPTGNKCCATGGYCATSETCCPPSPAFPFGSCAPAGVGCFDLTATADVSPARAVNTNARSGKQRVAARGQ
jgi:hypothetical protein